MIWSLRFDTLVKLATALAAYLESFNNPFKVDNPDSRNQIVVVDKLNERYGRNTVKVSAQGVSAAWQMKQERKSPNYTTSWYEVPMV